MEKQRWYRSTWIIPLFFVITFSILIHPYIENEALFDFAYVFGIKDFLMTSLFLMAVPMFVGAFAEDCDEDYIQKLCFLNSLLVFLGAAALWLFGMMSFLAIGLLPSIMYYFINSKILLLVHSHEGSRTSRIIAVSIVTAIALFVFLGLSTAADAVLESIVGQSQ